MLSAFQRNLDPCVDTVGPIVCRVTDHSPFHASRRDFGLPYRCQSSPPRDRTTAKYIELNEVTEIPNLRSLALDPFND